MSAAAPPDLEALYALLTGEPFFLSVAQIAGLTDRQVYDVILYPRDDKGRLKPKPERFEPTFPDLPPTPENQRAVLFAMGSAFGIPADELERVWREKHGVAEQQ